MITPVRAFQHQVGTSLANSIQDCIFNARRTGAIIHLHYGASVLIINQESKAPLEMDIPRARSEQGFRDFFQAYKIEYEIFQRN